MTDVNIPGDDIESARDNMRQVLNLFGNSATSSSDLAQALGNDGLVLGAANDFENRWSDGHFQLQNEGQSIIDALTKVLDTFTDTDNQIGGQLTSGQ